MIKTLFTSQGRRALASTGLMLGALLLGAHSNGLAQQTVSLCLKFDAGQNRYEVVATPNFTAKNFTWGPSQVSIVVPASITDESLALRSTNVGTWADNSMVYAPGANPSVDFHGVTTSGSKLDMTTGVEVVLFDFSLKAGFVPSVRLYNPAIDPSSATAGMNGGDFSSYMSDAKGHDYLALDHQPVSLNVSVETPVLGEVNVVAYPNPATGGKFRLFLKGFDDQETLSVQVTNLKGVPLTSFMEKTETLSGRVIDLGSAVSGFVMVTVQGQTTGSSDRHASVTRKVWFR